MLAWISKDQDGNYILTQKQYLIKRIDENFIKQYLRELPKDEDLPVQIKI